MMNVRAMDANDYWLIKKIHEKFYAQEFSLPDFMRGFFGAFVITNDEGQVVTAGGVKPIAETILVTDKDFSIKERNEALLNALNVSQFLCKQAGLDQMHVFIQDEKYKNLLRKRVGFTDTKGQALVLNF